MKQGYFVQQPYGRRMDPYSLNRGMDSAEVWADPSMDLDRTIRGTLQGVIHLYAATEYRTAGIRLTCPIEIVGAKSSVVKLSGASGGTGVIKIEYADVLKTDPSRLAGFTTELPVQGNERVKYDGLVLPTLVLTTWNASGSQVLGCNFTSAGAIACEFGAGVIGCVCVGNCATAAVVGFQGRAVDGHHFGPDANAGVVNLV